MLVWLMGVIEQGFVFVGFDDYLLESIFAKGSL